MFFSSPAGILQLPAVRQVTNLKIVRQTPVIQHSYGKWPILFDDLPTETTFEYIEGGPDNKAPEVV